MKKTITITESQLKEMVKNSLMEYSRHLNEAESEGWVVETDEAEEAYNLAVQEWGEEETNAMIIRCLGYTALSECLAYIFRMNDFRKWPEYQAKKEEDDIHESKDDFEAAKYNGKWSVFDKVSRTYSNIGVGKKKATEKAKELNQPIRKSNNASSQIQK